MERQRDREMGRQRERVSSHFYVMIRNLTVCCVEVRSYDVIRAIFSVVVWSYDVTITICGVMCFDVIIRVYELLVRPLEVIIRV